MNRQRVDAPDTRPIYQTIAADLRERITGGRLRVGERLPSETELCRDYGVSRMTVRQALSSLQASGLLLRRQGKGTFVASTKGERSASRLLGFEEDTISRGLTPGSTVLASGWGELDAEAQLLLDRSGPEPAFLVDRLRTVNDEPIGINRIIASI